MSYWDNKRDRLAPRNTDKRPAVSCSCGSRTHKEDACPLKELAAIIGRIKLGL